MRVQFVFGLLLPCMAAEAAPIDCDKLAHTKMPYALTTRSSKSTNDTVSQIYRSDNNFMTSFSKTKDGLTSRLTRQGVYALKIEYPKMTVTYEYNYISTDQPVEEFRPQFYDMKVKRTINGEGEYQPDGGRVLLTYLPVVSFPVGPCVFPALHFIEERRNGDLSKVLVTEKWFSPTLDTNLRFVIKRVDRTKKDGAETVIQEVVATGISDTFEPYTFP